MENPDLKSENDENSSLTSTENDGRSKAGRGYPVLHVRFEPELHAAMKRVATGKAMTMQDLVRTSVEEYLKTQTTS